jgi:mRNA-degrading endonuclease RelE of RelBE toxin-antitoxin system
MKFILGFTKTAEKDLKNLKKDSGLKKQYEAVTKTLELLQQNPRHPSLHTHLYHSLKGPNGEKVFEAYAEQQTPSAYRIFFYYGHTKGKIVILTIIPHP